MNLYFSGRCCLYFTGFADEAAKDLDGQIRATKELGWTNIEMRNVDGKNVHEASEEDFEIICSKLEAAGVRVNCFGSTIANWGKRITDPFDSSLGEVRRAIPRMKRLKTKLVRVMSFAVLKDRRPDDQMQEERFRRLRELVGLFADEGIQVVHENCANYGGMGWAFTLRLLEAVPGLKLVFDIGNPVVTPDYSKPEPRPRQSSWEFYQHVREHIEYVHVKDAIFEKEVPGATFDEGIFTFPGEGHAEVRRIVAHLLESGYDGGLSIEPHLSVVFHKADSTSSAEAMYASYVEYGRRFMQIVEDAGVTD